MSSDTYDALIAGAEAMLANRPEDLAIARSIVTEIHTEGWIEALTGSDQRAAGGFIFLAIAERGSSYLETLAWMLGQEQVPPPFETIHDRPAVAGVLRTAAVAIATSEEGNDDE